MPSRSPWGLVAALALASACKSPFPYRQHLTDHDGTGPRILAVVAHPDDEISFAGTLYKTSHFLAGRCDVAVRPQKIWLAGHSARCLTLQWWHEELAASHCHSCQG